MPNCCEVSARAQAAARVPRWHKRRHCTAAQVCVHASPSCHVLSVLVVAVCCVPPLLPCFLAEPVAPTAAGLLALRHLHLGFLILDTASQPLPPSLPSSQAGRPALPGAWEMALCGTFFCRLALRHEHGLLAMTDLILVTRRCPLQRGGGHLKRSFLSWALNIPGSDHFEPLTTSYNPEAAGTPITFRRRSVSWTVLWGRFPPTAGSTRTQSDLFAVLLDLGGVKDTARHRARDPAGYIV